MTAPAGYYTWRLRGGWRKAVAEAWLRHRTRQVKAGIERRRQT